MCFKEKNVLLQIGRQQDAVVMVSWCVSNKKRLLLGVKVMPGNFANAFATYFNFKVITNSAKAKVSSTMYNGKCQLIVGDRHFMTVKDVEICLKGLSNKKCEGYDRIPVCSIFDSRAVLIKPFAIW